MRHNSGHGSNIVNKVDDTSCEVLLYGMIGRYWDIDTSDLIRQLEKCRKEGITKFKFHVNSEGGEVAQIQALWNYLNRSDISVTWIIDGMAASSAYLMMTNPDHTVLACKYSKILIHRVSGFLEGSAEQMRAQAETMDLFENDCIQMISDRCGKTFDVVKTKWFDGIDHWLSPDQAIAESLIDGYTDGIEGLEPPAESLVNPTDIYNYFQSRITNLILKSTMDHKDFLPVLGLDANSPENVVKTSILNAVNKSRTLETENTSLKTQNEALQNQVKAMNTEKIKSMISAAITAKKITEDQRIDYQEMAEDNYERTQRILDKMPSVARVLDNLSGAGLPEAEKNFSWDDYHKKGTLENLKASNPARFKELYKARFNKEYENQ